MGHVVPDRTTRGRAEQRVMAGEVTGDASDHGAFYATGVCDSRGARNQTQTHDGGDDVLQRNLSGSRSARQSN